MSQEKEGRRGEGNEGETERVGGGTNNFLDREDL